MKTIINKTANGTYAARVTSTKFPQLFARQLGLTSVEAARAVVADWLKDEVAMLEASHTLDIAIKAYNAADAAVQAAQDANPKLYIYDWVIAWENANDGLKQNEGIKDLDASMYQWPAVAYEYMAASLLADSGYRLTSEGIDPAIYGIKY